VAAEAGLDAGFVWNDASDTSAAWARDGRAAEVTSGESTLRQAT
jgi:hypothetical protein